MRIPPALRSASAGFFMLVFLVQLVSGAALLLYVRHIVAGELERSSRTLVAALRDDFVADYRQEGQAGMRRLIAAHLAEPRSREAVVLLDDPQGVRLAGNIEEWPATLSYAAGWRVLRLFRLGQDRAEMMGVSSIVLPGGEHLLVGHVIEGDLRVRRLTGEAALAALLLAVPLALLGAVVATRVVTVRVERVADTARRVGAGDLSIRVPIEAGAHDAFTALGSAINAMLERIEALVVELRVVTDSLAHDLRSPLTRLRATIERAARETDDEIALAALDRVAADAQALLAMLATALEISRAEAGIGRDRFVSVDLGRMARDLTELYGPLAEDGGMTVQAEGEAEAAVHRELLGQALGNLVDNAIKYGRPGGAIRLAVTCPPDGVHIAVEDDGPGIAPEHRAEALRRFGRLDPARGTGGAGLGLALAAAVARLHGGTLTLGDRAPGLSVTIALPR